MPNQKRRGRSSKFTPEVLSIFYETLSQSGSIKACCDACGISSQTYLRWIERYPDFAEKVTSINDARSQSHSELVFDRIKAANQYVDRVLLGQEYKVIYKETIDPKGNIVTLTQREQIKPSEKLLERVLGQVTEEQEIKLIMEIKDVPD